MHECGTQGDDVRRKGDDECGAPPATGFCLLLLKDCFEGHSYFALRLRRAMRGLQRGRLLAELFRGVHRCLPLGRLIEIGERLLAIE